MLGATPALAQGADESEDGESIYARPGFYVGVGGALILEDVNNASADNTGGLNLRAGYRLTKRAAFEIEGEWVGGFDPKVGGVSVNLDTYALTASAKAHLLFGRVQPNLQLGLGIIIADAGGPVNETETDLAFRVGVGVDVYATQNIVVVMNGTWVAGTGRVSDITYGTLGLGLQYRF